jgi:triosephosphate isomerase
MKYLAGNWKLNKSPNAAREFASQFKSLLKTTSADWQWVIFPQALAVDATLAAFQTSTVQVGVQNIFGEGEGAFTGENSAAVAFEMGARFCLVGHSERRQLFGEGDAQVAQKIRYAQKAQLIPLACIGETLEQRTAGQTSAVIEHQLASALSGCDPSKPLWIAYEPVWAIGTGQVATVEQVAEVHALIRSQLRSHKTPMTSPILYGGSVKPDNAERLAAQPNVDGFLVGGASLNASSFFEIGKATVLSSAPA